MALFYIIFTVLFMATNGWAMESIIDQPSQEAATKALFKRLRNEPGELVMKDFKDIYKLMEHSFAKRTKDEKEFYKGSCAVGRYMYSIVSHDHLSKIFGQEKVDYYIHLKGKPTRNVFGMQITFEVLVDEKRLFDFNIFYEAKMFVSLLSEINLLKGYQKTQTSHKLDDFLETPPIRHEITISNALAANEKARGTAKEVTHSLADHYVDLGKSPLTSRTDTRRRAFSQRKGMSKSQAHAEGLVPQRRMSDEQKSPKSEKKDIKEAKDFKDEKHSD
jgi:hypothetical protein